MARGEVAFHEVPRLRERRTGLRGEHLLRPHHPAHSRELHEAGGLVTADVPPLPAQQRMHLSDAVHAVVLLVEAADLGHEKLITQLPGRGHACLRGAILAGSEEPWHRVSKDTAEAVTQCHSPAEAPSAPNPLRHIAVRYTLPEPVLR